MPTWDKISQNQHCDLVQLGRVSPNRSSATEVIELNLISQREGSLNCCERDNICTKFSSPPRYIYLWFAGAQGGHILVCTCGKDLRNLAVASPQTSFSSCDPNSHQQRPYSWPRLSLGATRLLPPQLAVYTYLNTIGQRNMEADQISKVWGNFCGVMLA